MLTQSSRAPHEFNPVTGSHSLMSEISRQHDQTYFAVLGINCEIQEQIKSVFTFRKLKTVTRADLKLNQRYGKNIYFAGLT